MSRYQDYINAWKDRLDGREQLIDSQRSSHLALAQRIAEALRAEMGAGRIHLFGSLADGVAYDEHSDIDLAVEGIPGDKYFAAVGLVESLCKDVSVDLVLLEEASGSLQARIRERGVEL